MKDGELLYFSEGEFALMMELAGDGDYTVFLTEAEPDERTLTEAFVSLFRRGLLVRTPDTLTLSESGAFFREMRNAPHYVVIHGMPPEQCLLVCYIQGNTIWLSEVRNGSKAERYRLSRHTKHSIRKWLLDVDALPRPQLRKEDVKEIETLFADELKQEPDGTAMARIERFTKNGTCELTCSLYPGAVWLLYRQSGDEAETFVYTQNEFNNTVEQCFGG